jgi:hypothetical protein
MLSGHCNCGTVAFKITSDPKDVYICHCSICRRWTGNNGIAVVLVAREDFCWTRGETDISSWKKPDGDWLSTFCRTCGSALPGENDAGRVFVPAGLLDASADSLRVAAHIWVGSKACWDEVADSAPQFEGAFGA